MAESQAGFAPGVQQLIDVQLQRINQSPAFRQAGRMYPLLEYLVREELAGAGEAINQARIAFDVFGRGADFDSVTDSIVRVEVGRLRNKLREYYDANGSGDAVVIALPKGQYRPQLAVGRVTDTSQLPALPQQDIQFCRTPDDVTIAYATMGAGPPLVKTSTWLTHLELDYRLSVWHHYWLEFSRERQLIRYDSRNMGLSQRNVENFGFDDLVTDLESVVDAAGIERFALFGTSQGTSVAAAYAARHPERVSHLILLSGMLRGPRMTGDPMAAAHADAMDATVRAGWQQPDSIFRGVLCKRLISDGTPEQFRQLDELQMGSCDTEAVIRYANLVHHIDVVEESRRILAPTLILHAKGDRIPIQEAHLAASIIPDSRFVQLDTENHLLQADERAWSHFVNEVNAFLST